MDWIDSFDLFLFDFDGLLVDTEPLHFAAYQQMCLERNCILPWTLEQFYAISHSAGPLLARSIYALFPTLKEKEPNWEVLRKEKNQIYLQLLEKMPLYFMPGALPLLDTLAVKGKKRCVVTNSTAYQIDLIKKRHRVLETIPYWFTREMYVLAKPAPDGYLKALSVLQEEKDQVIGFEDSLKGYEALTKANISMPLLICSQNHPQMELKSAQKARHFPSLEAISASCLR